MFRSILSLLVLMLSFFGRASHIVGGDIYYDYLGGNQYRIYVSVYRDCASNGAAYDDPMSLGIFDSNQQLVQQLSIPFPGSTNLPVVFNNPCVTPPSGICVQRAIYSIVVNLPPIPGGYTVAYQRCCRGPNVTNLSTPDDTGLTLTAHITGTNSNALINSSPRFVNYPPLVICNNEDLQFNHGATDPDGDSLVYELVTPNAGANSIIPQPVPPPPPNYPLVSWAGGYNAAAPLGPGSTTTINPQTGLLFVDANQLGLYVVGIRVNEYRNGVLISSTTRDFLFRVVNCIIQLQANITSQENTPGFVSYCQGLTFTFDNQSFGGQSYAWDFGVSGTTTDVSTDFEPTYTFPAPGIYDVTLVVNPGWPCSDTAHMTLNLNNPLDVEFTYIDSICFLNNSVDFTAQGAVPAGTVLNWSFGSNAIPTTANDTNAVNGVNFTTSGTHIVKLVGTYNQCIDSIEHTVFIFPDPVASFSLPTNYQCLGLTQSFSNTSSNATQYLWDFGVSGTTTDISTDQNPTFTFPTPGTYTITLTAGTQNGCSNTTQQTITVYEPLAVSFTHNDSLCITNNSFDFVGTVTGPSITTYSWDFGSNATPPSATTLNVSGVVFSQAGSLPVTLTASFLQCSQVTSSSVFVFKQPTIGFGIVDGLHCAPYQAQFIDYSTSDTPINYLWDLGDGTTSAEQNPTHIYPNPGQYSITLSISTNEGCEDTLVLTKPDFISVHPSPVAGFDIDPQLTDICHATITFTDQSEGGTLYSYIFNDGEEDVVSEDSAPSYTYTTPGTHRPVQVVKNEFGCMDMSSRELYIEPFTVYIPNTFTPDGDEFNNTLITVSALEAVEWEFRIYNRWGELLYYSMDPHAAWDGTYNGKLVQEGVYGYTLRYISCSKGARWAEINGHFSVLR